MKITTALFDLDGTLLPMDNDEFTKSYFTLITQTLAPHGYKPEELIKAIMTGITAMVKNDGIQSNEAAFWKAFSKIYGEKVFAHKPIFDEFYKTAFQNAKASCGYDPKAAEAVRKLKESGYRVILATNPISRAMRWRAACAGQGCLPRILSGIRLMKISASANPTPDTTKRSSKD